jgi:hypothetical protein
MRVSSHSLVRTVLYSWIAAVAVLAVTPVTRGQTDSAQPPTNVPSTLPPTMHFKRYAITDTTGFQGVEVLHGIMPVDWNVKGGVTWQMNLGPPNLMRIHWSDPQDISAIDVYPFINFVWSDPSTWNGRYQIGQPTPLGMIVQQPPTDQFDAFDKVIVQHFRPDLKNATVVNKENMPNKAKEIFDQVNNDPNYIPYVAVGKETFEYQLQGQTVQEVISGVFYASTARRTGVIIWNLSSATSVRAPKATFDQLSRINAIMVESVQMNPEWNQKLAALLQQRQQHTLALQQQQAANQQAQFNATESRISSQTAANDAQHDAYWEHSADLQRQSDAEADVQRQVSPWKGADGQTYKLPTTYGNAWQGADGTIIMNNDAGYNPNTDSSLNPQNWTQLQQAPGQ